VLAHNSQRSVHGCKTHQSTERCVHCTEAHSPSIVWMKRSGTLVGYFTSCHLQPSLFRFFSNTSNVTSVTELETHVCFPVRGAPWWVLLQHYVAIVECGIARFLCAMRVFEVRASSSTPRLPLCQISFLSRPPLLS